MIAPPPRLQIVSILDEEKSRSNYLVLYGMEISLKTADLYRSYTHKDSLFLKNHWVTESGGLWISCFDFGTGTGTDYHDVDYHGANCFRFFVLRLLCQVNPVILQLLAMRLPRRQLPTFLQEDDASYVDTAGSLPQWTAFGSARDCDYVEERFARLKCLVYAEMIYND
jgi:hypothetical protein